MKHRSLILAFCVMLLLVPTLAFAEESMTNWALGKSYTYSMAPEDQYADTGGQLTDGKFATIPAYNDPAWVGHLRSDFRTITVDLGEVRPIQEVRANFLQQISTGIYYPQEVMVEVSADGILWDEVGLQEFRPSQLPAAFIDTVIFDQIDVEARYVRITVLVDVWVFIDEIEVLGT